MRLQVSERVTLSVGKPLPMDEFVPGRRDQRFPFEEPESNTSLIFVEEPVVTRFIAHWSRLLLLFAAGLTIGFLPF